MDSVPMSLSQFARPEERPKIFTITGEGGVGKTSLACLFPDPVVIRIEDGVTTAMDNVICSPVITSSDQLFECINALATEKHDRKTVIFDSITQANVLFEKEVIASDKERAPASINQALGGFNAGNSAVSEIHGRLRQWAGKLSTLKNMHVVFIAHAEDMKVDLPDADPYTRYTLRLNKKSVSHYTDNVDCVAFVKLSRVLKTGTKKDGPKKALGDGSRIITCHSAPAQVSKNRFGIKVDLPFAENVNPFAEYLKIDKTGVISYDPQYDYMDSSLQTLNP